MIARAWGSVTLAAASAGSLLLAAALVLRLSLRDRSLHFSWLFYGTPWPVLAVGAGMLALVWNRRKARPLALLHGAAAAALVVGWLVYDWEWRPPSAARGELRVVLWNVMRPDHRLPPIATWLKTQGADVIAIAEREPKGRPFPDRWLAEFPGYASAFTTSEMVCLVRGEILGAETAELQSGSFVHTVRARIRRRELTILQTDLAGSPFAYRGEPLRSLGESLAALSAENVILLGDLNTPRDSGFFQAWRPFVRNAFEATGRGCAATWPAGLPVLSLDHIWSNARLRPVRCEMSTHWLSDHRAVVAEFDFAP